MINNLHIYPVDFTTGQTRIRKETKSLIESGLVDEIFIGAMAKAGLDEIEWLGEHRQVWRAPLLSNAIPIRRLARLLGIGEWGWRLLRRYRSTPIHIVQCHSLSCLPVGVLFKRLYGSKLVYDCHELETETASSRGARKIASKMVERALIHQADRVLVVGEFIRQWYQEHYGLDDLVVVRNMPYRTMTRPVRGEIFRQAFGLEPSDMLFIYQGVFALERKTDLLLRTFAECGGNKHVVFMGWGSLQEMVIKYAQDYPNIHYQPAVPSEEIIKYTASADVGLCILEAKCLSYQFSLANKFFEYLTAGVPVLASDFPEMGAFIDQHGCGWAAPADERELTTFIGKLSWAEVNAKRKNVLASQGTFGWEDEAEKLLEVYHWIRLEIEAA